MSRKKNTDSAPDRLDDRAQQLFKLVVEHYIEQGRPMASKALAELSTSRVSSATVRNVMSDLEHLGLVRSPHTSAGKIPTTEGLRLFVDSMLSVRPLELSQVKEVEEQLSPDRSPSELVSSASELLAHLTHMACVVTTPKRDGVSLQQIEFVKLPERRLLAVLVMSDREVQNRVIHTDREYSPEELVAAANFLNQEFCGKALLDVRNSVLASMQADKERMDQIMQTAMDIAARALDEEQEPGVQEVVLAGETNLLDVTADLDTVRSLFDAFSRKGGILHLLDRCLDSDGIQLFIGRETGYANMEEISLVTAPYEVNGALAGVLGVVGPTRMAYNEVIPAVDVTARLLGAALRHS